MPAPLAGTEDIERLRSLDGRELQAAEFLLDEASARLRQRVRSIDDRIEAGQLDPVIPRGVVCRMVIEVLNNPDGYVSEQIDDAVYRFDPEMLRKRMVPTTDELADLAPPKRSPVGMARTRPVL